MKNTAFLLMRFAECGRCRVDTWNSTPVLHSSCDECGKICLDPNPTELSWSAQLFFPLHLLFIFSFVHFSSSKFAFLHLSLSLCLCLYLVRTLYADTLKARACNVEVWHLQLTPPLYGSWSLVNNVLRPPLIPFFWGSLFINLNPFS